MYRQKASTSGEGEQGLLASSSSAEERQGEGVATGGDDAPPLKKGRMNLNMNMFLPMKKMKNMKKKKDVGEGGERAPGEEEKTCRICLETEGDDFIAPCSCRGTQRYVHRSCLDKWRATRSEGFAFSACTECKTKYRMKVPKRSEDESFRKWKFRMLVFRDIILVLVIVQLAIIGLALFVRALDIFEGSPLQGAASPWTKNSTNSTMNTNSKNDSSDIDNSSTNSMVIYYMIGLLFFLSIIGIVGCVVSICFRGNLSVLGYHGIEAIGPPHPILMIDCIDYSAIAGSAGEGAPILLLLFIIAFTLLTVVGVFYGMILSVIIAKKIYERHAGVVRKRLLTQDFVVMDLDDPQSWNDVDPEDPVKERALSTSSSRNMTETEMMMMPERQHARLRALGLI